MKTLATITLAFLLIGTSFSQKFVHRTLNDISAKPLGDVILDSAIYDKGTDIQVRKYFNSEHQLTAEWSKIPNKPYQVRTKYTYLSGGNYTQNVENVYSMGSFTGVAKRDFKFGSYGMVVQLHPVPSNTSEAVSSWSYFLDSNNMITKSRLDSALKDGTTYRRSFAHLFGEQGTVQKSSFESVIGQLDRYKPNSDTLDIKSYALNYKNDLVEVDYFMTKTDTIFGYPFIFCLQPQSIPVFSKEQVATTKDKYGNILTASYGGHSAIFYYHEKEIIPTFYREIKADNGLKVYPTIITSTLNIVASNELKTVSVFNLGGVLVHKEEMESDSIDLSELSRGMYIVLIETEKGISNHKIVKQ